jgi:hypothetical protein
MRRATSSCRRRKLSASIDLPRRLSWFHQPKRQASPCLSGTFGASLTRGYWQTRPEPRSGRDGTLHPYFRPHSAPFEYSRLSSPFVGQTKPTVALATQQTNECPPMTSQWCYTRDGRMTFGPVTWQELKRMALTGELLPSDVVGPIGMVTTMRAGKVAGLWRPFDSSEVVIRLTSH